MMLTVVAVLATSVAFAGNTSELRMFITQFFATINMMTSMAEDEDAPEVVQLNQVTKALKAGLLKYEEELTAGDLSQHSQTIDDSFTAITNTLNKIKESSSEVEDELMPQVEALTKAVLANQTKVQPQEVNQEMASALIMYFAQAKAEQEGTLLVRASRVLQQEMIEGLGGLMGEEE